MKNLLKIILLFYVHYFYTNATRRVKSNPPSLVGILMTLNMVVTLRERHLKVKKLQMAW